MYVCMYVCAMYVCMFRFGGDPAAKNGTFLDVKGQTVMFLQEKWHKVCQR